MKVEDLGCLSLCLFALLASTPAFAQNAPTYSNIRFEQDCSLLSARSKEAPPFTFFPLGKEGKAFLSLGGQLRFRGEGWSNFGFGGPGERDDYFSLSRLRLHMDLCAGSRVRFFLEGKSSLASDRNLPGGLRRLDVDTGDFQNALVDVKILPDSNLLTLRLGRQEMQFGRQRLVSPLDWSNTRLQDFDGVRGIVRRGAWRIDTFYTRFVLLKKHALNSSIASDTDFYGAYAAGKLPGTGFDLDLYWLALDRDNATFAGFKAPERRHTLGVRLGGRVAGTGLDFDVEGSYQFGDHGSQDIEAFMFASQVGYRLVDLWAAPRIYNGFDFASGDGDPADGKLKTFNQLFPLGHAYFGYIDIVGRQNILDWSQGVSLSPVAKVRLSADVHNFWRAERNDALYNAGGFIVRGGGPATPRRIGWEIDSTVRYTWDRHTLIQAGYSHFFPGAFIRSSGASDGIDYGYLTIQLTF